MIKLTRIDGEPFVLNAELIRYVESRPDTFVSLTTGERVIVRESLDQVIELAVRYQQQKHWMPMPTGTAGSQPLGSNALSASPAPASH